MSCGITPNRPLVVQPHSVPHIQVSIKVSNHPISNLIGSGEQPIGNLSGSMGILQRQRRG